MGPEKVIPYLPDDVVQEILARLPAKSFHGARAVCKTWYHLTYGDFFVKLHCKNCPPDSLAVVEKYDTTGLKWKRFFCVDNLRVSFWFSLDYLFHSVQVKASSNGLLCCSMLCRKGLLCICNPLTGHFKLLPLFKWNKIAAQGFFIHLPKADWEIGFTCNLPTQTYRVIMASNFMRITPHGPERVLLWFVFDSESNKWRLQGSSSKVNLFRLVGNVQAVFVNEAFHWLEDGSSILAIDMKNNLARIMYLPMFLDKTYKNALYLFELNGRLSIVETTIDWMYIWELALYKEELWKLMYRVDLLLINLMVPPRAISLMEDDVFLLHQESMLIYNRKTSQWKMMCSGKDGSFSMMSSAFTYRGTLCSCG